MSSETNSIDQMPKKSPLSFQVDLKKFEKATDEEKRQQDVMSESVSFFKDGMRKLMKNPLAVGSIIVLIVIIAMILIVPHVVPYKYSQIITVNGSRDKAAGNMAPFTYSEKELAYMAEGGEVFPHIMGTDSMGRDYFIRVIYGTRVSLTVGLFAAVIVLLIGVVYGSISGYFGGKVDMVMMRIVDIIYSLPDMLMVVLLSVVLREVINVDAFPALQKIGTNMISMFIVFALLYQPKPKNGGEDLMPSGMDGMMEPNGALPMDDAGLEEGTAEPADTQLDEEDLTEGSTAEDGSESEIEGDGINANPET